MKIANGLVTPIVGAIVADQYLGKYKTIVLFSGVYMVGLLILVCTSIPAALHNGAGLGGFIVSILIIGLGTGGIKSNVAPLVGALLQVFSVTLLTWTDCRPI